MTTLEKYIRCQRELCGGVPELDCPFCKFYVPENEAKKAISGLEDIIEKYIEACAEIDAEGGDMTDWLRGQGNSKLYAGSPLYNQRCNDLWNKDYKHILELREEE